MPSDVIAALRQRGSVFAAVVFVVALAPVYVFTEHSTIASGLRRGICVSNPFVAQF